MRTLLTAAMAAAGATLVVLTAGTAYAQTRSQVWGDPLTQKTETMYVRADEGMMTYNSQVADSKETKAVPTYSIGGWAGEARTVGASLTSSDATIPFDLNGSSMHTSFTDARMMARIGYLIPSVGVSLSEIDVAQKDGTKTVGLYGTGFSTGLALSVPVNTTLVVTADANVVTSTEMYDKLNEGTKLGRRGDADFNAAYDITDKMVQLMVGYRYRQYEIDATQAKYTETAQGAYAGLRLGVYF